jgi:hypothetical protein
VVSEDEEYSYSHMDSLRSAARLAESEGDEYVEFFNTDLWNEGRFERRRDVARIPGAAEHCVLCFMTFASVERRIAWNGKHAHEKCVRRVSASTA